MARIRCDITERGLEQVRLVYEKGEDKKLNPFRFYVRVKPVLEKLEKDLTRVLRRREGQ